MPRRREIAPDSYIRAGMNGKLQKSGVRKDGWTLRRRSAFLDHLAATCNVRASEAAAGIRQGGAYPLRRRDEDFAAAWDAALTVGYARLEAMLIERAAAKIEIPESSVTDVVHMAWTWPMVEADPIGFLSTLEVRHQDDVLADIGSSRGTELNQRWRQWAHEGQYPDDGDWRIWLIMAGRGFGKTRAGAEWVSRLARTDGNLQFALVGATIDDVRKVMIEGESGLIRVAHALETVVWNASKGEVIFPSGAAAHVYSAENFEKLRGPEHHHAWCDEVGKWNNADACWDNLMLGLRLGEKARVLVTTTPSSVALLRRLLKEPGMVLRGGGTEQNHNLPDDFVATVKALYEGTRWVVRNSMAN